jgi:hypothetical protein
VNEEAAAQQWLLDTLEADTTLQGLVNYFALRSTPQTAPLPYVKVDRLDANDVYVIGLHRVWDDLTFLVRGITQGPDWTTVREIGDRIDAILHDQEAQTADLEVHSFREESFTDETIEAGDYYLHVGGIYRLRARSLV